MHINMYIYIERERKRKCECECVYVRVSVSERVRVWVDSGHARRKEKRERRKPLPNQPGAVRGERAIASRKSRQGQGELGLGPDLEAAVPLAGVRRKHSSHDRP